LNYAEIGDVIDTRSLMHRRFSDASFPSRAPPPALVTGSYNLHNGYFFFFFFFFFVFVFYRFSSSSSSPRLFLAA
jgi:hypothetical protein